MDEKKYIYFSKIIKFSLSNTIILAVFSIIEAIPLLIFFMELPMRFQLFVKGHFVNDPKAMDDFIAGMHKISYYSWFRKIIPNGEKLYQPAVIICQFVLLLLFYLCFFFLVTKKKKRKDIMSDNCREGSLYLVLEKIIINFYDHFYFRAFSILTFDILINYVCFSDNIAILILCFLCLGLQVFSMVIYFRTNRLCLSLGEKTKYPYDNFYMLMMDFFNLFLKIIVCVESNILPTGSGGGNPPDAGGSPPPMDQMGPGPGKGGEEEISNTLSICFFFDIFCLFALVIINITALKLKFLSPLKTVKAFFNLNFLVLFFFHFFIFTQMNRTGIVALFFISSEVFSLLTIYFVRASKTKMSLLNQNFFLYDSLSDSYEICTNKRYFEAITFGEKINIYEKEYRLSLVDYWDSISKKYYEYAENAKDSKKLYFLFNSFSLKVYHIYTLKKKYDFNLLFKIWYLLEKFKHLNFIYYLNLRFAFELLCESDSMKKINNNFLFNHGSYEIHMEIKRILKEINQFLEKKNLNTSKDYLQLAKEIFDFKIRVRKNYPIFQKSSNKNEYSRIVYRAIIEGILNHPVVTSSNTLFIDEDMTNYEEFLDKTFCTSRHLMVRIEMENMKTRIVEVGNELHFCIGKSLDALLPSQFGIVVKDILNDSLECDTKMKRGSNAETPVNSYQRFNFVVFDKNRNLLSFSYSYYLYSSIQRKISYVDGHYNLGKNPLLITEIKGSKEYLFLISDCYKKTLHISQELINFLRRNLVEIEINRFKKLEKEEDNLIYLNKISKFLKKVRKNLSAMLSEKEYERIKEHLNFEPTKKEESFKLNLMYELSLKEKKRFFKAYSLKRESSLNGKTITLERPETEKFLKDETRNEISLGIIDTNSQSGSSQQLSSNFSVHVYGNKEKKKTKLYKTKSFIFTVSEMLVILISIISLVLQQSLINHFEDLLSLNSNSFIIIKNLLLILIPFASYLGYPLKTGDVYFPFKTFLETSNGFQTMYSYSRFQLSLQLSSYSTLYVNFKNSLQNSGNKYLEDFLQRPFKFFHLRYHENNFLGSYYSDETFDSGFLSMMNQFLVVGKVEDFDNTVIYPIVVNETLFPVGFIERDTFTGEISLVQSYVYETMINFLNFFNELYLLQSYLEKEVFKNNNLQYYLIISYILFMLVFNLGTAIIYSIYFVSFRKNINCKINESEELLKDEINFNTLSQKIQILSDLSNLYEKSPIILINSLLTLDKENKKLKKPSTIEKNNTKLEKKPEGQKRNLNFLTEKFTKITVVILVLTVAFLIVFAVLYLIEYNRIELLGEIIINSIKTETLVYLNSSVLLLMRFVSLSEKTFFNTLSNVLPNESTSENFLLEFLSQLNYRVVEETHYKSSDNDLPPFEVFSNVSCDTLYSTINYMGLFKRFSDFYPQLNFNKTLVNFCNSFDSVKINNLNSVEEQIIYFITTLSLQKYIFRDKDVYIEQSLRMNNMICYVLFMYCPIRYDFLTHYAGLLNDTYLPKHWNSMIFFSISAIVLQIIIFVIIKFGIFDHISRVNNNMTQLYGFLLSS